MEIMKEITVWDCEYNVPNHTYLFNDSGDIIAYLNIVTDKVTVLKTPLKFDRRYRKFIRVENKRLKKFIKHNKEDGVRKFKVTSNDKDYIVLVKDNSVSCNCLGYYYRGTCKHTTAVKEHL